MTPSATSKQVSAYGVSTRGYVLSCLRHLRRGLQDGFAPWEFREFRDRLRFRRRMQVEAMLLCTQYGGWQEGHLRMARMARMVKALRI